MDDGSQLFAQIAVPLPIPTTLSYEVAATLRPWARPGVRARVRVGKRRLVGVLMGTEDEPPAGVTPRPLDEILDREPVFPPELLDLARFTSEYYLAPLGEVLKTMMPRDLPAWGSVKVRLTDQGALASLAGEAEEEVRNALLECGRVSVSQLQARIGRPDLGEVLDGLAASGRIVLDRGLEPRRGYTNAVELPAGDLERHREACGRSPAGRSVVEYLASLGRPATVREVTSSVGCGPDVVRRLVGKGVLRTFTQLQTLPLDPHLLTPRSGRPPVELRPDQAHAVQRLGASLERGEYAVFLLAGMTGSGKTEVYLRCVAHTVELGRSAILLVPEIALVPALAGTLQERFGDRLAVLHSALSGPERQQQWDRVRRGDVQVVLGPRSAIFAPARNLGLVVVDEEQDPAYKQDAGLRYNGRDLAVVRCRDRGAVAVLVSATPSLETRHNANRRRYQSLALTSRVGHGKLPEGILVDLRKADALRRPGEIQFSPRLCHELEQVLAAGDQAILLRNRRGYSPVLLCRACGEDMRCDDCGLPRTYHRKERRLLCHYCGSTRGVPAQCPACGKAALEPMGAGTERVEERFRALFPDVAVEVLDRDTVRQRGSVAALLERFERGQTQVLVGTQMVSKGHHFPRVALSAVLSADTYLGFPDFRAVERTYNLLTQLAGRAGRGERPGRVVIQTYYPEHYAIQAALHHDDERFAREELRFRRVFHYPPFSRMVQLVVRDRNQRRGRERIEALAASLSHEATGRGIRVMGPAPAPLEKLRGYWRFQLLLRSPHGASLRQLVQDRLARFPHRDLTVDVDPYDLL